MEFNSINNFNINRFANQQAGLVKNSQNLSNAQEQSLQPQDSSRIQQTPIDKSLMYDFQSAKMDNETVLKYLKSLLKLPESIDKFVNQLNSKNIDPKIASILVEHMISVKSLTEFLNQNSTDAISKLLQTISTSLKSGNNDIAQLKEILNILNVIQNNTSISTNSLKELILLYIPLNQQVFDKGVEFDDLSEDEKQNVKNSKISILFETLNFSNILCILNEANNDLLIELYALNDFPKDKFSAIINTLAKEVSLNLFIDFKTRKNKLNKTNMQNFKILSGGFISSNVLILAHLIIKTILKIDNEFI